MKRTRVLRFGGFSSPRKISLWLGSDGKKSLLPKIVWTDNLLVKNEMKNTKSLSRLMIRSSIHPEGSLWEKQVKSCERRGNEEGCLINESLFEKEFKIAQSK